MTEAVSKQIIDFLENGLRESPFAGAISAKLKDKFSMTPDELESAIAMRRNAMDYEETQKLLCNIIDNTNGVELESRFDRVAWLMHCAYMAGFRDGATFFNVCVDASIEDLCGTKVKKQLSVKQVTMDAAQK